MFKMSVYLGTSRISFDLEPEVSQQDRERVLRALRDKLRSALGHRVTVRTDDEDSVFIAFFDENLERVKDRLESIAESLENAGQARIFSSTEQIFCWFEGAFLEIPESKLKREEDDTSSQTPGYGKGFLGITIKYADDDDDIPASKVALGRKGLRLPTRKP
jgi:hypothetical protein